MPLASSIESIGDECQILHADKAPECARACMVHLHELAALVDHWLHGGANPSDVFRKLTGLNDYFRQFEEYTQPNFIVRLKQEQQTIRKLVIRINTIKETSFVGAGYAIVELASILLVATLIFMNIEPLAGGLIVVGSLTLLLLSMVFLIRDLDNPFSFAEGGAVAVEVSMHPLSKLESRIEASLQEDFGPSTTSSTT